MALRAVNRLKDVYTTNRSISAGTAEYRLNLATETVFCLRAKERNRLSRMIAENIGRRREAEGQADAGEEKIARRRETWRAYNEGRESPGIE